MTTLGLAALQLKLKPQNSLPRNPWTPRHHLDIESLLILNNEFLFIFSAQDILISSENMVRRV